MTQTPRPPIYKYLDIPEDEHFSQDRPSIVRACGGNYTRGKILGFLFGKASYIANKNGLSKEQAKVVTIFVEREEILEAIRISEPTYITHLNALKAYTYVGCPRYARGEYTVNFEAINKGIANPPEQIRRGRPKGTGKSLSNKRAKKASTSQENSSTSEIALTFIRENGLTLVPSGYLSGLEQKVKAISGELEELQEKVKAISENPLNITEKVLNINTLQKYLELSLKYFKLSPPHEALLQAAREAFSEPLDYLDSNEIEENSDAPFVTSPSSSSFADTETHSQLPIASRHYEPSDTKDVTHVSQESEAVHASSHSFARSSDSGIRPPAATTQPITEGVHPAPHGDLPDGTSRGLLHQGASGDTLAHDGNTGANGYEKVPDEEDIPTIPRLAAIKPTQQTPLLQATTPALSGDASESTVTPPGAFPRLSHTLQDTSLLGDMPLDALLTQPQRRIDVNALLSQVRGQPTRMAQGEGIRAGDTSRSSAAERIPTETAPMKPASQNKTVQASKNKKTRGKAETQPEKPVVPVEPEPDPLTAEEHELFDAWNSIFEAEVPLGPVTIETVKWLNKPVRTWARLLELSLKETLDDMRKSCYAKDKKDYFKKNGVRLYNLKDNFEGWQSAKQEELRRKRTETNELDRYRNSTTVIKRTEELRKHQTAGADIPATPLVARASTFSYDYR